MACHTESIAGPSELKDVVIVDPSVDSWHYSAGGVRVRIFANLFENEVRQEYVGGVLFHVVASELIFK